MGSQVSICPVPPEQRPINEYQDLKESCFFGWSSQALKSYTLRMVGIWSCSWLIVGPVAAASFDPVESPGRFGLAGAAGANLFLALILIRLYLGWSYVCDRLLSQVVVYEETGWYDCQSWPKPSQELAKERLVGTYEVRPTLKRLQVTLGLLAGFSAIGGVVWQLL